MPGAITRRVLRRALRAPLVPHRPSASPCSRPRPASLRLPGQFRRMALSASTCERRPVPFATYRTRLGTVHAMKNRAGEKLEPMPAVGAPLDPSTRCRSAPLAAVRRGARQTGNAGNWFPGQRHERREPGLRRCHRVPAAHCVESPKVKPDAIAHGTHRHADSFGVAVRRTAGRDERPTVAVRLFTE